MNGFIRQIADNGLIYYSIPAFDETGLVKTCFSSRVGGISKEKYSSLNLGLKTKDKKENVLENYHRICSALDIPITNLVCSDQVHGNNVRVVTEKEAGNLIGDKKDIKEVDGLITNSKNIGLVTIHADCVPIYLLDTKRKVIGLVHAGWKGTVLKIALKVVKMMMEAFNSNPKDILAAIGPSIGPCCYEVDQPLIDKFNENFTNPQQFAYLKDNSKYMLNLWRVNRILLKEMGILERNIITSDICTMCSKETMFSHRRDHGQTGRMAAIIQLI